MFSPVRGAGRSRLTAIALALGVWGVCGGEARAQHCGPGVPPGAYDSSGPVQGPRFGTFGPGYPGYGLEYVTHGLHVTPRPHVLRGASICQWASSVRGQECMYPYVADPYIDPRGAMVPWPPYSAPVAGSPAPVAPAAGPSSRR